MPTKEEMIARVKALPKDPMARLGARMKIRHTLRAHLARGGGLYITDCFPWAIKPDCGRIDCPMRYLKTTPAPAKADDLLIACNPSGTMADILQSSILLPEQVKGEEGG